MKKLALLFSFVILLVTPLQTFASQQVTKDAINEKEVLRLKEMFEISDEYKNFDFSTSTDPQGAKFYSYTWSNKNDNLYISVDKDGNIISYSNYVMNETEPVVLKNKADIESVIKAFVDNIDENILKNYKLGQYNIDIRNGYANFNYNRYVNDILVLNDSISVSVDLRSKKVNDYNKSYASSVFKDGSFPKKSDAISPDKAREVLNSKEPFVLSYKVVDEYRNPKTIAVYSQISNHKAIDALSGKLIEDEIYNIPSGRWGMGGDISVMDEKADSATLTDVEKAELDTVKGLASTEEAKKEVESKLNISGSTFKSIDLRKYNDSIYSYDLLYSSDESSETRVGVDAKTLEILNYNSYSSADMRKSVELPREEATKIAKDLTKKLSKKLDYLDLKNPIISSDEYSTYVQFPRIENSYYVLGNGVNVTINNSTKKVENYYVKFSDVKFEPISKGIGAEKALDIAIKSSEFKEYYAYVKDEPKLLFTFKDNIAPIISASDGTLLNELGTSITEDSIVYENIEKSKYKDEINYLLTLNIGVPNVKNLNQKIKVSDYIYLLNSISGPMPYEIETIKSLIQYNQYELLKEEDMDKNTTNKLAIRWALNFERYFKLNDAKDVFDKSVFSDQASIAKEDRAYFYLAYSLSIYDGKSANPDSEITHEDALHIVYNILN